MWQLLIPILGNVLDKVFPNAEAAAEAKLKVMELAQNGELAVMNADVQLASGQMEINKIEAASQSAFNSGWRPGAGWCCVFGLAYTFLIQPMLAWVSATKGWAAPPKLDIDVLMGILTGMMGLGGLRTFERIKGVIPNGK